MKNSCENLPEEFNNDGNTYCHGVVNCKYYDGECIFMDMGSGNIDDMPCRVREQNDLKAFREWRDNKNNSSEPFQSDLNFAIKTIRDTCKDNNTCNTCPMNCNCNEQPAKWKEVKGGEENA